MKDLLEVYKPRKITKQDVRTWQYKFFEKLAPGWNSVKSKPLTINIVRGLLRKFNPIMLPTIYAECEKSNNFSKNFWWKWKQLPMPQKKKSKKNLQLF